MIRATLNLPHNYRVGKAEARQAVLMALMGSCHASSLAKFLHDHMPRRLALDLKALVEDNRVTVRNGSSLIDIPLHSYCGDGDAQKAGAVSKDGCLSNGKPLHTIPGVQAALTALGVPANEMPGAVTAALSSMKIGSGDQSPSCLELIENLAKHRGDPVSAGKRIAAAIDAFAGAENVMLLRSWEATFTSAAQNSIASRHKDKLRKAILHGKTGRSSQDPLSFTIKAAQCLTKMVRIDPRFKSTAIEQVRQEFIWQFDVLLDERLQLFFETGQPAYLGVCASPDQAFGSDSSMQRLIQSADDFKSAIKALLLQAESNTKEILRQLGDASEINLNALRLITDHLKNYIDRPGYNDFLEHIASQFMSEGMAVNAQDRRELPWKIGVGRQLVDLAAIYFGKRVDMTSSEQGYAPDPAKPRDATHIVHFVLNTLWSMKGDIQGEVERSPATFHVPVAVHDHMFSLAPGRLIHDWSGQQTSGQWIEDKLKTPARAHVLAPRTEPPLEPMLSHVAAVIERHKDGYGVPQVSKKHLIAAVKAISAVEQNDDGAYTLQGVYQALSAPGIYRPAANPARFLDTLATAILQVEPPRTVQIADTHMESPTMLNSTDRLGALYNPFRDTINIHCMDELNDGHAPVKQEWLENPWHILTTPLHDTADQQAVSQA
jgi:hypothetical protein